MDEQIKKLQVMIFNTNIRCILEYLEYLQLEPADVGFDADKMNIWAECTALPSTEEIEPLAAALSIPVNHLYNETLQPKMVNILVNAVATVPTLNDEYLLLKFIAADTKYRLNHGMKGESDDINELKTDIKDLRSILSDICFMLSSYGFTPPEDDSEFKELMNTLFNN